MPFHSAQLLFNIVLLLFIGISNRVDIIMAHQCYSCGPKANVSCDKFDSTNKSFIKDCPSAKGCSTQTHGNLVERSCEDIGINDCKTANDVKYCFCSSNLCNGDHKINFSDDEDLTEEGSGTTVIANTNNISNKVNITSESSQLQVHLCSYIFILVMLCN